MFGFIFLFIILSMSYDKGITAETLDAKGDVIIMYTDGGGNLDERVWTLASDYDTFSIKACSDVKFAFSKTPDITLFSSYMVVIGANDNTKTIISKYGDDTVKEEFDTDQILDCDVSRPFWWKIEDNMLSVGKGTTLDTNVIGSLEDDDISSGLNVIHIASENNQNARWEIKKASAHDYLLKTRELKDYNQMWMTVHNTDHIIFNVKACDDVNVILSTTLDSSDDVYEIVLDNDMSVIRKFVFGPNVVEAAVTGLLNCAESRAFWIRWGQGVEVGKGKIPGEQEFMRLADPDGKVIEAVSLSTNLQHSGDWRISNIIGNTFRVVTPGGRSARTVKIYEDDQHFLFSLRSCDRAFFTMLMDNGGVISEFPIVEQWLDCFSLIPFWFYWNDTRIALGSGPLFENELYEFDGFRDPLTFWTLELSGYSDPIWEFDRNVGKSIELSTSVEHSSKYTTWLDVQGHHSISFKVKSCDSAQVVLGHYRGVVAASAYEIILSGKDSTKNTIKDSIGGIIKDEDDTVVLHCNQSRWIWISWTDTLIHVGQGWDIGGSPFLTWDNQAGNHPIESLAFNSILEDASWEFTHIPDEIYELETQGSKSEDNAWLSVRRNFFSFSFRGCGSAWILLAGTSGPSDFEIQFTNHDSSIKDVETGQTVSLKTADIIDCNSYRDLWVAWTVQSEIQTISIGTGSVLSNATYKLDLDRISEAKPIHHIGLASDDAGNGFYRFQKDSGLTTRVFTKDSLDYERLVYRSFTDSLLLFRVKACSNAHIALFDTYHTDFAYEIVLGANDNVNTLIRRKLQGDPVASVNTPYMLNCDRFKYFWASWSGGRISVGYMVESTPSMMEIVGYDDPHPMAVSYVAFSTAEGATGQWEFSAIPDDVFVINTNAGDINENKIWISFDNSERVYAFRVKTCYDAVLLLRVGGEDSYVMYKLVIGGDGNSKVQLYLHDMDRLLREVVVPSLLNCNEHRSFVLRLENSVLDVIQHEHNGRILFSWVSTETDKVHGLSIVSSETQGEWLIPRISGQHLRYLTEAGTEAIPDYCCLWHSVVGRVYSTFSVRACNKISLVLSEILGVITGNVLQVNIDTYGSDIRLGIDGDVVDSADENTSPKLYCTRYNSFWVDWKNGVLSVGSGSIVGQSRFLTYRLSNYFKISGISYGATNKGATWDFAVFSGNKYVLQTPDDANFHGVLMAPHVSTKTVVFFVQACNDAIITLSQTPGVYDFFTYQVIIGRHSNSQTVIKKSGNIVASSDTPDVLSCDERREFWIMWWEQPSGYIIIGKDHHQIQGNFLLQYMATVTPIYAVTVATGPGSTGIWEIPVDQEKLLRLSIPNPEPFVAEYQWVSVVGLTSFAFRVKACQDVHIVLAEVLGNTKTPTSEVVIGQGNSRSLLYIDMGGSITTSADTPDILDCDSHRAFYIRWTANSIHVGYGGDNTKQSFLDYIIPDDQLHLIAAIGMRNVQGYPVEYDILKLIGNSYSFLTSAGDTQKVTQLSTSSAHFVFRVRACLEAIVRLFPVPESDSSFHEVLFGTFGNTVTQIRRTDGSISETGASVETPYLLACHSFRYFWISWDDDGWIRAGSGYEPGKLELLAWNDPEFQKPDHLSIHSRYDEEWETVLDNVETLRIKTPEEYNLETAYLTLLDRTNISFSVKACQSAHIALSVIPGETDTLTYEVVLGARANTYMLIRDGVEGDVKAEVNINDLVLCNEFRDFWVDWAGGSLAVGRGRTVGESVIGSASDVELSFSSVALGTYLGTVGEWKFDMRSNVETSTTSTTTISTTTKQSSTMKTTTTQQTETTTIVTLVTTAISIGSSSSGISSGQAVGIAFGVLIGAAILTVTALFVYKHQYMFFRKGEENSVLFQDPNTIIMSNSQVTSKNEGLSDA